MRALRRFRRDESGVSAIEFALLVPFMAAFLYAGVQICNKFEMERKFQRAAAATADLVAQAQTITDTEMSDIFAAAAATIYPLDPGSEGSPGALQIVVTSLTFVSDTSGRVAWSDARLAPSPRNVGDIVPVPKGVITEGRTVIMAEADFVYRDAMGEIDYAGMTGDFSWTDKYYNLPRRTLAIGRVP